MSVASSWDDVGLASDRDVASFLDERGLGRFAQRIVEVTDAESVGDLRVLDDPMVEDVIRQADLKLIPAEKFRRAVGELRGTPVRAPPQSSGSPSAALEESPSGSPSAALEECVAICIDRSGSMGAPLAELHLDAVQGSTRNPVAERTRMEAVKAMFYAFRDRVESAGRGGHQLGLIQFDQSVEQLLDLTDQLDRFEAIVDDMAKRGQTAIYSAILQASRMLEPHFEEESPVDLRIVVLTDGQNNTGARPEEALAAAYRIGAVVDAIIVGDRPDANLRRIVSATGGECFEVGNLGEGFELLEAEGVVSLRARRGGSSKPRFQRREVPANFAAIAEKSLTRGTAVTRAPAMAPDLATKAVVDVAQAASAPTACTSAAMKRTMTELRTLACQGAGEGIHIFPAGEDLFFWRVLLEGPPSTPFEGGVFSVTVQIPEAYPLRPPRVQFETPVYHCNVSDSGGICLDILQGGWNPALTVVKALQSVRHMLAEPDTDNALRQWIAELTLAARQHQDARYGELARERTRQDASASVSEWRARWGC